jgi:hypothetical protein
VQNRKTFGNQSDYDDLVSGSDLAQEWGARWELRIETRNSAFNSGLPAEAGVDRIKIK